MSLHIKTSLVDQGVPNNFSFIIFCLGKKDIKCDYSIETITKEIVWDCKSPSEIVH